MAMLVGLLDSAVISLDTLVWTEGQESWRALKDLPDLYNQVYYISSNGQSIKPIEAGAPLRGKSSFDDTKPFDIQRSRADS